MASPQIAQPTEKDIDIMNSKITLLKARAKMSSDQAKESINQQVRAIEDQYELLKARFYKTQEITKSATGEILHGMSKAWDDLKGSIEKAAKQIH